MFLAVAIDITPVREWEIWDSVRLDGDGSALVVARLRNDEESRHTEELLGWIQTAGKEYEELGRTWKRESDTREGQKKRRQLFARTDGLVLLEGYVGPAGAVLQMWGKGANEGREVKFGETVEERKEAERELDDILVQALRYEATEKALRIGDDDEYAKFKRRLKSIHQQVSSRAAKRGVEFATAYVENIRADKEGSEEKGQRAIRIYTTLLENPENDGEKATILTNLGIAEFREARKAGKAASARSAIERWKETERLAENAGWVELWVKARNFQTEGELWIEAKNQDGEMATQAWRRQVETSEDTHGVIDELTALTIATWRERARRAAVENREANCKSKTTGQEVGEANECNVKLEWQWSAQDHERRLNRTERWINIARSKGDEVREIGLIGIRADLLRKRGVQTKEPSLLISSFAGTHEYRTRLGIVDPEIKEGELILIIDPVLAMVELEAQLALTCADRQYIETLVTEIRRAQLLCPRRSPIACEGRANWKRNLVRALGYAIGRSEGENGEVGVERAWGGSAEQMWDLAEHAKSWVERGLAQKSLCPNRPQGITEGEEKRQVKVVNKRTMMYRGVERTVRCNLPERVWTVAPKVPAERDELPAWREQVRVWIERSYSEVDQDIRTIRECEGEPE